MKQKPSGHKDGNQQLLVSRTAVRPNYSERLYIWDSGKDRTEGQGNPCFTEIIKSCMQHRTTKIKSTERRGNFKRKMNSGFWHTETYSNSKSPKVHCSFSM